jgi:O-6-methylguanine DNA methyltransferase
MTAIEAQLAALREEGPRSTRQAVMLGTGLVEGFAEYESPLGGVVVSFNPEGVSSVDLATDDAPGRIASRLGRPVDAARPPRGWDTKIRRAIDRGSPGDLPVDLRTVSGFQRSVLTATATIPRGEVRPYGWLAREVGSPGAVRAVGSAMARNPIPLIIPCHRVVRTDGMIGNYSLGGPHNKRSLLHAEGAGPSDLERLARRHIRLWGSDTTRVYCHPTCRNARRIADAHLVEFRTPGEAQQAGYRQWAVCRP